MFIFSYYSYFTQNMSDVYREINCIIEIVLLGRSQ